MEISLDCMTEETKKLILRHTNTFSWNKSSGNENFHTVHGNN